MKVKEIRLLFSDIASAFVLLFKGFANIYRRFGKRLRLGLFERFSGLNDEIVAAIANELFQASAEPIRQRQNADGPGFDFISSQGEDFAGLADSEHPDMARYTGKCRMVYREMLRYGFVVM